MAKGIIARGQFRGKVGADIFRVVDGLQVMQQYQPVVRNPRTIPQQMQRTAMRHAGQLVQGLLPVIRKGYATTYGASEFVKSCVGRNKAIQVEAPGASSVRYAALEITNNSAGALLQVGGLLTGTGSGTHLLVNASFYLINKPTDKEDTDIRVYLAVYTPDLNTCVLSEPSLGSAQTAQVYVPESWDGLTVHAWLFAEYDVNEPASAAYDQTTGRRPTKVSAGAYLGSGEVE